MAVANKVREKWDRIHSKASSQFPSPSWILKEGSWLLPSSGKALDIACGTGGNALYMAQAGLETVAIDISAVAIARLQEHAVVNGLSIRTIAEPVDVHYFRSGGLGTFDVITVSNYLDRELFEVLSSMLRKNGLLYYQTFVKDKVDSQVGPSNPDFLLEVNELLKLTSSLGCRMYFDLGTTGQLTQGLRNQSCIIAQKES